MQTRTFGNGPALSVVGLGCNNFGMRIGAEESAAVVEAALEAGITHFDTAEMYGQGHSEEFLGAALGRRRDQVVIATKVTPRPKGEAYEPGILRQRILEACEASLRRLGTDRIDLYYQHYPDDDGTIDEALEAFDDLVRAGKVLHLASSNVSAAQIHQAADRAEATDRTPFCGTQIEWNLLNRAVEDEVVPAAQARGLGVVPFFPLASGMLSGKYRRGEAFPDGSRFAAIPRLASAATDDNFDRVEAFETFAAGRGHSVLDLAIAWLLAQPTVTSVIAGATSAEQVRLNAAAGSWALSAGDLSEVPI